MLGLKPTIVLFQLLIPEPERPMTWLQRSQIFYNLFVGLAGLAGFLALIFELYRFCKILRLRRKYRPQLNGTSYALIKLPNSSPIYVHDYRTNFLSRLWRRADIKHHVANPETMSDVGFDWNSVIDVSREEYERIRTGGPINTKKQLL